MRAHKILLALGLATAFAGAATAKSDPAKKALLVPTGETRNCIQLNRIRETKIWDDNTIDFRVGKEVWRNTLPHSCPQLGFEKRYAFSTSTAEICGVDTITVLVTGGGLGLMRGATCGLGKFEKVAKASAAP